MMTKRARHLLRLTGEASTLSWQRPRERDSPSHASWATYFPHAHLTKMSLANLCVLPWLVYSFICRTHFVNQTLAAPQ
jgi:hypothetical protein